MNNYKCLRICVVAVLLFWGFQSHSQIGQGMDSVLINAKANKWTNTDSATDKLQFFGNGVNFYYFFKEGKCYYNLLIANKNEANKIKAFLRDNNFVFQSEGKTVEYAFVNEKMKAQATFEYEGKSVIVKIFPKLDFSEFHLKSDDSTRIKRPDSNGSEIHK